MVYLLCFDRKLHHAKHYIGFAENQRTFEARMKHHAKGQGSRLMAAVAKAGIGFCVSRTWPDGDRNFERKLKNRKKSAELCPHCTAAKKADKLLTKMAKENTGIVCPVVQKFDESKSIFSVTVKESQPTESAAPSVAELLTKAKEVYAESQGDTLRSRWARIWSRISRLWLVLKDKLVSK